MKKIFLFLASILLITGCSGLHSEANLVINEDYIFDARQASVGDQVAKLTIRELEVSQAEEDSSYFTIVQFDGQVTVTGELVFQEKNEAHEGWGLLNYFIPDKNSTDKIPVTNTDPERNGFTLIDNSINQLEELRAEGQRFQVKIIIEDYELWQTGKAQENKATLINIVEKAKLE